MVRYLKLAPSLRRQDPGNARLRRALFPTASLMTTLLTQPRRPTPNRESEICFSETTYACCSFWDSALEALHKHDWQKIRTCTSAYLYGSGEPYPEASSGFGADRMKNDCFWSNGTEFLRKKHYACRGENNELQATRRENTFLMNRAGKVTSAHPLVTTVSNSPYTPPVRFINIGKTQGIIMTTHSLAGRKDRGGRTRRAPVYNPRNPARRMKPVNAEVTLGRVVSNPNVDDATSDLLCGDVSLIVNKYSFTKDQTRDMQAESLTTELHDRQMQDNYHLVTPQKKEGSRYNSRHHDSVKTKGDKHDSHETSDKKDENSKHSDKQQKSIKQGNIQNSQTRGLLNQPSEKLNVANTKSPNVPSLKLPERQAIEHKCQPHPVAQTESLTCSITCSHPRNDTLAKPTVHQGRNKKMLMETSKQQPTGKVTKLEKRCQRIVPCREKNRTGEKSVNEIFENPKQAVGRCHEPADNELSVKVTLGNQQRRVTSSGKKSHGSHGLQEVPLRLSQVSKKIPHVSEAAKEHSKNKYRTYWKSKPWGKNVDRRHDNLKERIDDALKGLTDCKQDELVDLTTGCSKYLQKTVDFLKYFYERIDQCPTEWKGPCPRKSFVEKFRPYKIVHRSHSLANRAVKEEISINNMTAFESDLKRDGQMVCVANDKTSVGMCVCCSQHQIVSTPQRNVQGQFESGASYKTCDTVAFLDFFLHLPEFFQQQVKEVSKIKIPQKYLGRSSAATAGSGIDDVQQTKRIANQVLDRNKKLETCTEVLGCLSSLSETASENDVKDNTGEYSNKATKSDTLNIRDYFSKEDGHEKHSGSSRHEELNIKADVRKKSLHDMHKTINHQLNPLSTYMKVATEYSSVHSKAEHSVNSIDSFTISTLHQVTSFTEQMHSNKLYKPDADNASKPIHDQRTTAAAGKASLSQLMLASTCQTGGDQDGWTHRSKIPLPVNRKHQMKSQKSDTEERRPESQIVHLWTNPKGQKTIQRHNQWGRISREGAGNGSPLQGTAGGEAKRTDMMKKAMKYQVVITSLPKVEPHKAVAHNVEAHTIELHKIGPHKCEPHTVKPHKVELHKVEQHKVEPRKFKTHKVELHRFEPRNVEPHKVEKQKVELHKYEPHKFEPHKVEPHKVEPHNVEPHTFEPHKIELHKVEPYKVELHKIEQHKAGTDLSKGKSELHKAIIGAHLKPFETKRQSQEQGCRDNRRPHRETAGSRTKGTMDSGVFRCRTSAPKFPNKPYLRRTDSARNLQALGRFICRGCHVTPAQGRVHNRDNGLRYSRLQDQRSTWPPNSGSPNSPSTRVPRRYGSLLSSLKASGTGEKVDNRANIFSEIQDRKEHTVVSEMGHYVEGQWLHSASDEALLVSLDQLDRRLEDIHTQMTDSTSRTYIKEAGQFKRATLEHGSEEKLRAYQRVTPGLKHTISKSRSGNEAGKVSKAVEESRIRLVNAADTPTSKAGAFEAEAPQSKSVEEKEKGTDNSRKQLPTSFTKQSMSEHRPKLCRPGVRTFYRICDHATLPSKRPRSRGYEAESSDPCLRQNKDAALSTPLAKMVMAAINKHSRCLSPERWRHTMELQRSMKHPRSLWRPTSHGADNKVMYGSTLAHNQHISPRTRSPSGKLDRPMTAHEIRHHPEGTLSKEPNQPEVMHEGVGERKTAIGGEDIMNTAERRYVEDERLVKPIGNEGLHTSSSKLDTIDKLSWLSAQFKQPYEHDQCKTVKCKSVNANDTNEESHLENSTVKAKSHSEVPIAASNSKMEVKIPTKNMDKHVCCHHHRKTTRDVLPRNKAKSATPRPGSRPCSRQEQGSKKGHSAQGSPIHTRADEDKCRPISKISTGARSPDQSRAKNTTVSLKIHQKDTIHSLSSSENASCRKQKSACSNSSKNLACSASRAEQVRSPTDQFTEVECPDEKHCRRTKLVRTVPEDLLVSFWSRKYFAAASDKTRKKAAIVNKYSSKENITKEKRQEVQQAPILSYGSRGLGHIVVAGNLAAIKCDPQRAIKLPEKTLGLLGKHEEFQPIQGSIEKTVALNQERQDGSATYSLHRWTSVQGHGSEDTMHNIDIAPTSRDNIQEHPHSSGKMVSTITKGQVEDKWPKRGSKSDHCWTRQSCERSSSRDHHLTEPVTPAVLVTKRVPFLAGKEGPVRNSSLSADNLPTLSPGNTRQSSVQEQSVPGLWSFESERKGQSSRNRLDEISHIGPREPIWAPNRYFRSGEDISTAQEATDNTSLERYVDNADTLNAIVQEFPSRNINRDNSGRWEATDQPRPSHKEGSVTSESFRCQPEHKIPPESHISWQKFLSVIFTDPACLPNVRHIEDNIKEQPMKEKHTVHSPTAQQDRVAENQSSGQEHDTSSKDHFSDTNLSMKDRTDVVCKQSASEYWYKNCPQGGHKGASSSPHGHKHRRFVNPSDLIIFSTGSAGETKAPENVAQLWPCSRCHSDTLSRSREDQHTHLFLTNDNNVITEKNINSNKESKLPDVGLSTQATDSTDYAKDNTTEFEKTSGLDEVTNLQENEGPDITPVMFLNRFRCENFVRERNRFSPSRFSKSVMERDHSQDGKAARQHAHFVSKLPIASKQAPQEQPRKPRKQHEHDLQEAGTTEHEPLSLENDRSSWVDGASIKKLKMEQAHQGTDSHHQSQASQKYEDCGLRPAQRRRFRMIGSKKCVSGSGVGDRQSGLKDNWQTNLIVKSNIDQCRSRTCKHEGSEFKYVGIRPSKSQRQAEASLKEAISAHQDAILARRVFTDHNQESVPRERVSLNRIHNCIQHQHQPQHQHQHQQAACTRPPSFDLKPQGASSIPRRTGTSQPPSLHSVRSCQSKCFLLASGSSASSVSPSVSISIPRVKAKARYHVESQPSRNLSQRANRTSLHDSPAKRIKGNYGGRPNPAESGQNLHARNNFQSHEQNLNKNRALLKAPSTQKVSSPGAPLAYTYPELPGNLNPQKVRSSPDRPVPGSSGFVVSLRDRLLPELKLTHARGGHTHSRASLHPTQTDIRPVPKPRVGFSYLIRNVSDSDSRHLMAPPCSDHRSRHHTSLRIKPPKEDSFVGKIVKMFEKRFQFLPSEDSQKYTEGEESG